MTQVTQRCAEMHSVRPGGWKRSGLHRWVAGRTTSRNRHPLTCMVRRVKAEDAAPARAEAPLFAGHDCTHHQRKNGARMLAMTATSRAPAFRQPTLVEKFFNRAFGFLVGLGFGLKYNCLLQVRGRKSGRLCAIPWLGGSHAPRP